MLIRLAASTVKMRIYWAAWINRSPSSSLPYTLRISSVVTSSVGPVKYNLPAVILFEVLRLRFVAVALEDSRNSSLAQDNVLTMLAEESGQPT